MKIRFILYCLLVFSFYSVADEIKLGESLDKYKSSITKNCFVSKKDLGLWPENEISIYSIDGSNFLLVSLNKYPFAIITNRNGQSVFLLDYNGDSILDSEIEYIFVPGWVIEANSKSILTNKIITRMLEKSYDSFQNNPIPYQSKEMFERNEDTIAAAKDLSFNDRIPIYYDYLYNYLYNNESYKYAFDCLIKLYNLNLSSKKCKVALYIFTVELANKAGQYQMAKERNSQLLSIDPYFIPGLYYQYLFETEINKKNLYKSILLTKYRDHWIVKNKIH